MGPTILEAMRVGGAKFHSYGNDFFVIEREFAEPDLAGFARDVCDPHFGVGADGCVFLRPAGESGGFHFRIFNRDGGEAEMSGNGLRCAAAFLIRGGRTAGPSVALHTAAGDKDCRLLERGEERWRFTSRMGRPRFEPAAVPFLAPEGEGPDGEWTIEAAGRPVRVRPLSVGNPQCVVLVAELPEDREFDLLGRALESHPLFPRRSNVSFVRVAEPGRLQVRIWERGVGPTHSSGTGACGAAVAAIRAGLARPPVEVETATGTQTVEWSPGGEITLTGWAELIAEVDFLWRRRRVRPGS